MAGFLLLFGFNLLVILGALLLVNCFSALFFPASTALIPRLLRSHELEKANGVLLGSTQAAQMVGSAAGGVAIAAAGVVPGLLTNALTYVVSVIFVLQIAASFGAVDASAGPTSARKSLLHDIREGIAYMRSNRPVMEVTLGFIPANFFWVMIGSFFVVYAAKYFPNSPTAYGFLVAGLGGGFAVGALLLTRVSLRQHAGTVMAVMVILQGGVGLGLSFSRIFGASVLLAAALGATAGIVNAVYYAAIQAIVPSRFLARIVSVDQVGSFAGIPAGLLLGGVIAARDGIGVSYIVAGVGLLLNGTLMLGLKDLRGLRYGPDSSIPVQPA